MKTYIKREADGSISAATENAEIAPEIGCDEETDLPLVEAWNNKTYVSGEEPPRPITFADYDNAMEAHLDAEKAERGYTKREPSDYAGSSNPRWAQDAEDWIAHRDAVMAYGLEVENKAKRGEQVPTLDEFKAGLQIISWTFNGD